MKRFLSFILVICMASAFFCLASCQTKKLDVPQNVKITVNGIISWDKVENAETYDVHIDDQVFNVGENTYTVTDVTKSFSFSVVAKAEGFEDSDPSAEQTFTPNNIPPIPVDPVSGITIAITGTSEVRSGQNATLKATVTGAKNDSGVTWTVSQGSQYVSVNAEGVVSAVEVDGDKTVKITATSKEDPTVSAEKVLTVVTRTALTQEMLDVFNDKNKVAFEGFLSIALYTSGMMGDKYHSTHTSTIQTAMDGTNWFAKYENITAGVSQNIYYKDRGGVATQVGVSFMNDEEYFPLIGDDGEETSWSDAGLYNSLKGFSTNDFKFDDETWRWSYRGTDTELVRKIIASANPYDFDPTGFSLIIDGGEIVGIYSKSEPDFTISQGFKAIQELFVAINYSSTVEVPTIGTYSHEDVHDDLQTAINNMRALKSYNIDFREITGSSLASGTVEKGNEETVTDKVCYFRPYNISYREGQEEHNFIEGQEYGYRKVTNELYNSFSFDDKTQKFTPNRAFKGSFDEAKPSFAFAAEIFRSRYVDEETGEITYYADSQMTQVATTFYKGVGNDVALYGIFATEGLFQDSSAQTFKPYVVVKDGYIIESGFYFYMGSLFGVIEIKYGDFNNAQLPSGVSLDDMATRTAPVSWSDPSLIIHVSDDTASTEDDEAVPALQQLQKFFGDSEIGSKLPFFGDPLEDTYGFGLTTMYTPVGSRNAKSAIVFYYDVPLDINYTIDTSMRKFKKFLLDEGFTRNQYDEFTKDGICIAPVDASLDFTIYVWKA